jgi:hypothetical protein
MRVIRNGHDKIIRFDRPIQMGGSRVRAVRIHNYYLRDSARTETPEDCREKETGDLFHEREIDF